MKKVLTLMKKTVKGKKELEDVNKIRGLNQNLYQRDAVNNFKLSKLQVGKINFIFFILNYNLPTSASQ